MSPHSHLYHSSIFNSYLTYQFRQPDTFFSARTKQQHSGNLILFKATKATTKKNDAERYRDIMVLEQDVRAQESLLARKTRCRRARSQVAPMGVSKLPTRPSGKTPERLARPIRRPLIISRGESGSDIQRSRQPSFPARHTLRAGNRRRGESSWMRDYPKQDPGGAIVLRGEPRSVASWGQSYRANGPGVVRSASSARAGDSSRQ